MEEKKEFCPYCTKEVQYRTTTQNEDVNVKGTIVNVPVTLCYCSECGNEIEVEDIAVANQVAAFEAYKKAAGLLSGVEIRAMRERYGVSASCLSRLLGLGEKTITRYENGAIQDKSIDTSLRLVSEPDSFIRLLSMNEGLITKGEAEKAKSALKKSAAQLSLSFNLDWHCIITSSIDSYLTEIKDPLIPIRSKHTTFKNGGLDKCGTA